MTNHSKFRVENIVYAYYFVVGAWLSNFWKWSLYENR